MRVPGIQRKITSCSFCTAMWTYLIRCVSVIKWIGIHICSTFSGLHVKALVDIKQKLQIGYGKVVANRGRYSRRALARLYSTFYDHSVLFVWYLASAPEEANKINSSDVFSVPKVLTLFASFLP